MLKNSPTITSVEFRFNPYGGWYAYGCDAAGKRLIEKYYLGVPRVWFKFLAWRWLKKTPVVEGYKYTR